MNYIVGIIVKKKDTLVIEYKQKIWTLQWFFLTCNNSFIKKNDYFFFFYTTEILYILTKAFVCVLIEK